MVEYLGTLPDVPDIFNRVQNGGIFLREDIHKAPELLTGDDHEDNRNSIRETTGTFNPRHAVTKTREVIDQRPGITGGYQTDDHVPQRDHLLDLHAEECTKTITGEISKQVPVICKIRKHEPGRKEPDTGLGDTDAGRQIGMPPGNINRPDGLQTCFNDPGNEDKQGNC
jgi:hypothetical protein